METLYVNLLGSFTLYRDPNGPIISEERSTSKILWAFLQYLLVFHDREVSQEELIDILWGDGSSSNPVNTLKTLLHRSRLLLEELGFPDGKKVLLYRRGIYSWSKDVNLILDTERFDSLYTSAENCLSNGKAAIQLYQGDLLPKVSGTPWALSLRTYYHGRFLKLCREIASSLMLEKHYDQVIDVCNRAIFVDPYDEHCHLMLMKALNATGQQQLALQHYSEMADLFMKQLGVSPSSDLLNFYRDMLKSTHEVELDLHVIRDQLLEKSPLYGAFYCELGVFQDIYRIEARNASRSGQCVQLIMLTVKSESRTAQGERFHINTAMQELYTAIQKNLRSGDVFTRFSSTQYLLLTPSVSYENGLKIIDRVLTAYGDSLSSHTVSVDYSLLPVLAAVEEST